MINYDLEEIVNAANTTTENYDEEKDGNIKKVEGNGNAFIFIFIVSSYISFLSFISLILLMMMIDHNC